MAARKWKQSSPEAVKRFDEHVAVPGAERKVLFGCPVYVLDGERYATLYQESVVLLLPPDEQAEVIKKGGAQFEPIKGRRSKDRVVLPESISSNPRLLRAWVKKAVTYASGRS